MCGAVGIFVFHPCGGRPALRPIGPHCNKCTGRNLSVIFLPLLHAIERQNVIWIFRCLAVHVDDNKGEYHFLWINLIYGAKPLYKMSRRINMRSPLTDM